MKILVTGRGTSGSWQVRGVQLGRAIGAHVEPQASTIKGYDLVVVVKRCPPDLLSRINQVGVPIVWDVVDSYPQPEGNSWDERKSKDWLLHQINTIRPKAIVAATERMAKDCTAFGVPVLDLPHHARPGQATNPIRKEVRKIGYEGSTQHLGIWERSLKGYCLSIGVEWVVNPPRLTDLDIVVAVRGETGYAPRNWKSNVKLANAQDTGTPCILARESGYIETSSGAEMFADDMDEMAHCIQYLLPYERRRAASSLLKSKDVSLETMAKRYGQWLSRLKF